MGGTCSTHGVMGNSYNILVGKLKETDHSEDLGINRGIIIKLILRNRLGRC
jgi:hypothetical protein